MATKKFVKNMVEATTKDLEKKGLIIGGGILAVTMIGDLIGGLRTNNTRKRVVEYLEGFDSTLERIENAVVTPAQPQPEEKNEEEGSDTPSNGGTK